MMPPSLETLARLEAENAALRNALAQTLRHIESLEAVSPAGDTPTRLRTSSLEFEKLGIFKQTGQTIGKI